MLASGYRHDPREDMTYLGVRIDTRPLSNDSGTVGVMEEDNPIEAIDDDQGRTIAT